MTVATWGEFLEGRLAVGQPLSERPARLAIGVFDGVHLGHRRLIAAVTEGGSTDPGKPRSVVVTFRRPPGHVLGRVEVPHLIMSLPQKLRRLAGLGVEAVVLIDFSDEIGTLSGRDFIDLVRGRLAIERIVVGPDFRFGRNRDADVHDLEAMLAGGPTTVQVIEPVRFGGGIVSSSRIRRAVLDGDLELAAAMLDAPHEIDLAGVASVREAPGVLRFARAAVPQVLPAVGRFAVTGRGAGEGVPGTLEAAGEAVVVRLAREAAVTALTFDTRGTRSSDERSH